MADVMLGTSISLHSQEHVHQLAGIDYKQQTALCSASPHKNSQSQAAVSWLTSNHVMRDCRCDYKKLFHDANMV